MKEHQKFFSVRNPATARIEGFVTVANVETPTGRDDPSGQRQGPPRPPLDARFFWENDLRVRRSGMDEWKEGLKTVTFHNKLGSQWDRIQRIQALAREIAPHVGADPDLAAQAAEVAKLDLRSAMVGEFPSFKGLWAAITPPPQVSPPRSPRPPRSTTPPSAPPTRSPPPPSRSPWRWPTRSTP
jgi:glycyl-tRNA synthetase beta chain